MQGRDSNYNSNFKSMTDLTIDNPYEDIFKFMVESEINSRNIERCELENLRSMYEDFQELSSRYDNGRKERDDVFLLIEKQFLAHPRQIEPIGFSELDYNLWDTEDESKVEKLRALFQHLNRTILDNDNRSEGNVSPGRSPGRSPNRQAEQLRSQENAFNAKIDILEHENNKLVEHADNIKIQLEEASDVIKQLNRSISDRDKECANFKIEKVKMNEQFATRELEQENEILDLCDEVNKKTKQLEERELMSPTSPQRHNTNALGESDVSALTREQLKTELTIKINDIRALENVSEKNKELVQNLFGTIDECMWTITQLKLGRPKKFTTPIGGLSQIIAKSVMGQIQDIGRFAKRFFSDSNVKNLEIDTVDNALDRSKYSQSSTTTPRRKKKSKFLKFLKPKKMPNEEELKKIVRDSFEIYDENQSGELERDEIRRLLDDVCEDINAPPVTDEKLDAAIVACDEDMNGKFNYDELYKLLVPLIESSFDETKKMNVLDIFKPKSSDNTPRRNKKKMFAFLKVKKIPTEDELKAIVKDSFEKYDEDKSGYLEREEIRKLLDDVCEEVGAPAIDDKNLEEAIVAADANGDGKFNCDELFSLIAPIITNAMTGEKKPTLFDVFKPKTPRSDISPDKKKNKKNLFDFMKVKKMPSEEELREMVKKQFEAYDEDESGYLERDEIRKLLDDVCGEIGSPIVTDEALDVAIEKADQNKDGKFNFGETFDLVGPILENAMSGQKKPTLLDIFKPKTGGDVTPDGAKTPGGTKKTFLILSKEQVKRKMPK